MISELLFSDFRTSQSWIKIHFSIIHKFQNNIIWHYVVVLTQYYNCHWSNEGTLLNIASQSHVLTKEWIWSLGVQMPLGSKHLLPQKLSLSPNIHSWVENECRCLYTVDIINVNFTNKYIYDIYTTTTKNIYFIGYTLCDHLGHKNSVLAMKIIHACSLIFCHLQMPTCICSYIYTLGNWCCMHRYALLYASHRCADFTMSSKCTINAPYMNSISQ